MTTELAESKASGRRATVTNVEKKLGVTHATFYRNYGDLIEWFKAQLAAPRDAAVTEKGTTKREDDLGRLRRENTDLRTQVRIYAEAIRQLTLDKAALEDRLQALEGVTSLDQRRRHPTNNDEAAQGSTASASRQAGRMTPAIPCSTEGLRVLPEARTPEDHGRGRQMGRRFPADHAGA
jgi:hypothetical protein